MLEFIWLDLKNNFGLSVAYTCILTLLTTIEYIFFELVNYPDVITYGGVMFNFMTIVVLGLLVVMTIYLNHFYIEEKRTQIVFLSLSGSSLFKLGIFLLVEYFIMLSISLVISFVLGKMLFYGLIQYASHLVVMEHTFSFSPTAIVEMVSVEISKCIFMVMLNISFIYKNELADIINKVDIKKNKNLSDSIKRSFTSTGAMMGQGMAMMQNEDIQKAQSLEHVSEIMKQQREVNQQVAKKVFSESAMPVAQKKPQKGNPYHFFIYYAILLAIMVLIPDKSITCLAILLIGAIIFIFLKTKIYAIFERIEDTKLYDDAIDYVVYQDVLYRSNTNQAILLIMNIALPFFIFEATTRVTLFVEILACFSFVVLLFMLIVLFLLKNILDIQHSLQNYHILHVLGFQKEDLSKIATKSNHLYYFLSLGLSLLAIMIFTIKMLYPTGMLCVYICLIMVACYVLSVFISIYYHKSLLRGIK